MAETVRMESTPLLKDIRQIIDAGLSEDIGPGDITTSLIISDEAVAEGAITAEEDMVLAGIKVAEEVFRRLDPGVRFDALKKDGDTVIDHTIIARIHGRAKALISGERVALNFLQRLSGIATLSRKYAGAVQDTHVCIVDTRKTTPGLRSLEKYAVRVGGCRNHRYGLFDGVLIKENHIAMTLGVGVATSAVRKRIPHTLKLEVEVKSLEEVEEAIIGGADIIMLDNMDIQMMEEAISIIRDYKEREILIEASGGMGIERIRDVASTGVDIISVGALTHSASWVNISMDISPEKEDDTNIPES